MRADSKYASIYTNREKYSASYICEFFEVSKSGYYDWIKRKDKPDKDDAIVDLIKDYQKQIKQAYGYRRVKIWLLREAGLVINHKSVLGIMRKYGLLSVIRRPIPFYQRYAQFKVYEGKSLEDVLEHSNNFYLLITACQIPSLYQIAVLDKNTLKNMNITEEQEVSEIMDSGNYSNDEH